MLDNIKIICISKESLILKGLYIANPEIKKPVFGLTKMNWYNDKQY